MQRPADAATVASAVNVFPSYGSGVPADNTCDATCSHVARLLKEAREKRGFSLNLVAEKAGLSRPTVSFIENELRHPTLETLLRLTRALEVDLEVIIGRARKLAGADDSGTARRPAPH